MCIIRAWIIWLYNCVEVARSFILPYSHLTHFLLRLAQSQYEKGAASLNKAPLRRDLPRAAVRRTSRGALKGSEVRRGAALCGWYKVMCLHVKVLIAKLYQVGVLWCKYEVYKPSRLNTPHLYTQQYFCAMKIIKRHLNKLDLVS